jgi:ParB family chromosome partitioning protein
MKIHELKCIEPYFSDIARDQKTFEIRKADRDFREGDFLHLKEYDPVKGYSGRELLAEITYIIPQNSFEGLTPGYDALGIEVVWSDT